MHDSHSDPNPRAVLWDLDGTLTDTMAGHFQAWRVVLAGEGYALSWEAFAASFGQRNDAALCNMLGAELPTSEVERISAIKEERFRGLVREEGLQLLPGVASRLRASRDAGWRQALVTSAPRATQRPCSMCWVSLGSLAPWSLETMWRWANRIRSHFLQPPMRWKCRHRAASSSKIPHLASKRPAAPACVR